LLFLVVYVDDIVLAGKSQQTIEKVKTNLGKIFRVKDMGELHYFLGVHIKQNFETGKIWIGQPSYAQDVLEKFGLENCKPAVTPVATGTKLLKATEDSELFDTTLYQFVGMLLYLLDQISHLLSVMLPGSAPSQPKNIGWQLSIS